MENWITSVRLDSPLSSTEDHIIAVKLASGVIQTIQQVINSINLKNRYYFTDFDGNKTYVEVVHLSGRPAYIRTEPNKTLSDNLLKLARF
jgi:hypothetical protein